ncbi:MAG: hypothetical protein QXI19_09730, partial [Candidatus Caldarchaeum sp.]
LKDLATAKSLGLSQEAEAVNARYERTVFVASALFQSLGTEIRNLLSESKLGGESSALLRRLDGYIRRLSAFGKYWDAVEPPEKHRNSHERWGLACNLLIQSAWALDRFVRRREPMSHSEAYLLQIEAMRELAGAQEAYQAERRQPT